MKWLSLKDPLKIEHSDSKCNLKKKYIKIDPRFHEVKLFIIQL